MRFILLVSLCLLAFASRAESQQHWVIDRDDFARFEATFSAAAPGDVIQIRTPRLTAPFQRPFDLRSKGVVIRGEGSSRPQLWGELRVSAVPAGETMHLEHLHAAAGAWIGYNIGAVVLRDLTCDYSAPGYPAWSILSIYNSAQVLLLDCSIAGVPGSGWGCWIQPDPGISVYRSRVVLVRCQATGSPPYYSFCYMPGVTPYPGYGYIVAAGPGIVATDASVLCFDSSTICLDLRSPGASLQNTRFLASPPSTAWIGASGPGISDVRLYGSGTQVTGTANSYTQASRLPSTRVSLAGDRLRIDVSQGGSHAPGYMGMGLRLDHVLLAPIGAHGAILMPLDRSQSALFDTFRTDAAGQWSAEYRLPPTLQLQLRDRSLLFQAYVLDPHQTIWAGSPDLLYIE